MEEDYTSFSKATDYNYSAEADFDLEVESETFILPLKKRTWVRKKTYFSRF